MVYAISCEEWANSGGQCSFAIDPKILVAKGYDEIGGAYLDRFGQSSVRTRKLEELVQGLSPHARVLDLGCGAGLTVARDLTALGLDVTGIDISTRQIDLARENVPTAYFVCADMMTVELSETTFDAVAAFYSITHVPREEHGTLLGRIAHWLKPNGRFIGSFGTAAGEWQGPWLGTTMYFSHHDPMETKTLLVDAGLAIEHAETLKQDNEDASFLWVTARKI